MRWGGGVKSKGTCMLEMQCAHQAIHLLGRKKKKRLCCDSAILDERKSVYVPGFLDVEQNLPHFSLPGSSQFGTSRFGIRLVVRLGASYLKPAWGRAQ